MRQLALMILTVLASHVCFAGASSFDAKIYRHKSPENRTFTNKVGLLTFDDDTKQIRFKDDSLDKLEIPYESVNEILFEVTSHIRGGTAKSFVAGAVPVVGMVTGPALWGQHVHNYWVYVEYGEQKNKMLFEVPHESSKAIIDKATRTFGSKVTLTDYPQQGKQIDPAKLPDSKSKETMTIDKRDHPLPEVQPDKATIVVVCPPLNGYNGRSYQFKVHANDRVIAVNKWGTYSFAYLEPGKYRLISQSENAYAVEMQLEAGKSYYFLQNSFQGLFKSETSLTRNSPELVMYLLDGSYYSDWKPR